ncbi:hypothetical protein G0Q06_04200 [Puniceicoccales bacterium CK1056]|uniref:Uncharacterized protein n=1 Tax=Oceanipulchritudo coccoides TaxID=2706888 RepID=A0A6B2M1I1_9BACT|nr:hypothetical protein [Oceanipulchritudo coccoides]NDV61645.1 hypothetical protein [Oceanipulchritudo coccoides]
MKKPCFTLFALVLISHWAYPETLKPYIMAGEEQGTLSEVQLSVTGKLAVSGFEVLNSYSPADDPSLSVICVTHADLKQLAAEKGGLTGFAMVLRVGLEATDTGISVSYMNPVYWGAAYLRSDYESVESVYTDLQAKFEATFSDLSTVIGEPFGSKKGLKDRKLKKYHYMMAMPYFDDVNVLSEGVPYEQSIAAIEANAASGNADAVIVYKIELPGMKMALYGTGITGEKGEATFLPKIDFNEPRHAAFLPYEMLVLDNRVVSLHGKYRIALSFPDLKMGTFMKIMSTPGDIAKAQESLLLSAE